MMLMILLVVRSIRTILMMMGIIVIASIVDMLWDLIGHSPFLVLTFKGYEPRSWLNERGW